MSWIEEKLAATHAELLKKAGHDASIFRVLGLNPDAMAGQLDLYTTLMLGDSGLSRLEREAVAVVVSANNECAYCVQGHGEALREYLDDNETLEMLMTAEGLETLEPRLSNIVRHAEKLTNAPDAMTEVDLGELRAVGLSDRDILDLTLIAGYFSFLNRIALGLGVFADADQAQSPAGS